ncbi:MAG: translocation/assembly module TamB domain-containing protein [Gammaproteobacteria bacterium]
MGVGRAIGFVVVVAAVILVLVGGALIALATTESGTRVITSAARALAPPSYRFGAVSGTLARGLVIDEIALADDGWTVAIERVAFQWRPRALLRERVHVTRLTVTGLDVELLPSAEETDPVRLAYPELPIGIRLDALVVDGATLRRGEDTQRIERISAAVEVTRSRLDVRALEVVADGFFVAGELGVADGRVLAVSAALSARLEREPQDIEAGLRLAGRLDAVRLEGSIAAGVDLRFGGTANLLQSPPAVDVSVDVDAVTLGEGDEVHRLGPTRVQISGTTEAARVTASATLALHGLAPRDGRLAIELERRSGAAGALDGRFDWRLEADAAAPWPVLSGQGVFDYVDDRVTLEHTSAAPLASTLHAEISDLAATPVIAARLDATAIALPLADAATAELERVTLELDGQLDALDVTAGVDARHDRVGPLALALVGRLEQRERFVVESFDAAVLDGSVAASGAIDFADAVAAELDFAAREIDLSRLIDGVDTRLGVAGRAIFANVDGKPSGELVVARIEGDWREHLITGRATANYDGAVIDVQELELAVGANTLSAAARLGETLAGRFDLRAVDLAEFAPALGGRLTARGTLSGTPAQPAAEATVGGEGLRYAEWSVATVEGELDIDLASAAAQRVRLAVDGIRQGDKARGRLDVKLEGPLADHRLNVSYDAPEQQAEIAASGGWVDEQWRGAVRTVELALGAFGTWELEAPVALSYADASFTSERACLRNQQARLCATVPRWSALTGHAAVELTALPLDLAAEFLPTTMRLQGTVMADVVINNADGRLTGRGELTVADGSLAIDLDDGATENIAIPLMRSAFELSPEALVADLAIEVERWITVNAELRHGLKESGTLDGHVRVAAAELSWLEQFVPDLAGSRGAFAFDARLAGTQAQPEVEVDARLSDGALIIQPTGMRISTLDIAARTGSKQQLTVSGELGNADGTIALDGVVELDGAAVRSGRLTLTGARLAAVRLPDVEADLAPDLVLTFSPDQLDITGSIALPRVHVDIKQLPDSAVAVSGDEVLVGVDQADGEGEAMPDFFVDAVSAKVDIEVGDDVWITAAGLRARLAGGMRWTKLRGASLGRGEGRVSIAEGGYTAYGQDLGIERGHLTFAGAIDNPQLDVRAVRRNIDIVAGVLVSGSVRDPKFDLFSEPAMPDSDVLSYIITGRPLDSASSGDANIIAQAALSLGAERSSMVTSRIQDAFGLDEFSVNTGATAEQTSLSAGKRLTPKLSVRSEFNPFDRLWSFFLNYKLTENWSIEAESGARQGADLIYSIERERLWPPPWFGDD